MLAIAISLLFGLTAFCAIAVIALSVVRGVRQAGHILAELRELDTAPAFVITRELQPARELCLVAA